MSNATKTTTTYNILRRTHFGYDLWATTGNETGLIGMFPTAQAARAWVAARKAI